MVNSFAVNKDDILLTRAQKKQLKDKEVEGTEKTESTTTVNSGDVDPLFRSC